MIYVKGWTTCSQVWEGAVATLAFGRALSCPIWTSDSTSTSTSDSQSQSTSESISDSLSDSNSDSLSDSDSDSDSTSTSESTSDSESQSNSDSQSVSVSISVSSSQSTSNSDSQSNSNSESISQSNSTSNSASDATTYYCIEKKTFEPIPPFYESVTCADIYDVETATFLREPTLTEYLCSLGGGMTPGCTVAGDNAYWITNKGTYSSDADCDALCGAPAACSYCTDGEAPYKVRVVLAGITAGSNQCDRANGTWDVPMSGCNGALPLGFSISGAAVSLLVTLGVSYIQVELNASAAQVYWAQSLSNPYDCYAERVIPLLNDYAYFEGTCGSSTCTIN